MAVDREMTFEEAIARLEEVVKELEDGRLPLAKSLEIFAEGISLSQLCNRHLEDAEQRIYILTEGEKGDLELKEAASFPAAGGGRQQ